ncbi:MAG: hypothetical protein FWC41_05945 [Firmicutes bacterium]|nr:hypothetical protein [Bacillota bacterium]
MNKNPHLYVKKKLKERRFTFDEMTLKMGVNRTTLYRLLQPEAILPHIYRDGIINFLNLNKVEQEEFQSLLNSTDEKQNDALENPWLPLLFSEYNKCEVENFVSYYNSSNKKNNICIVPSSEEPLKSFFSLVINEIKALSNTQVRIYLGDCFYTNFLYPLVSDIHSIVEENKTLDIKISHFVNLTMTNLPETISHFNQILSLTSFSIYEAYNSIDINLNDNIYDLFLITYGNNYWFGDIRNQKIHVIYSNDAIMLSFLENKFILKQCQYKKLLQDRIFFNNFSIDEIEERLNSRENRESIINLISNEIDNLILTANKSLEYENNFSRLLVKSNLCFEAFPTKYLIDLVNRAIKLLEKNNIPLELFAPKIRTLLDISAVRTSIKTNPRAIKNIDFLSELGTLDFLESGRISDHPSLLGAFTKEEAKEVFKEIYNRSKDSDNYKLYICQRKFFNDKYCLLCIKGFGFSIEYVDMDKRILKSLHYIEDKNLSNSMYEYMYNEQFQNNLLLLNHKEIENLIENA